MYLYETMIRNNIDTSAVLPMKTIENTNCDGIVAVSFVSNDQNILILDRNRIDDNDVNFTVQLYDTETAARIATMKSPHQ